MSEFNYEIIDRYLAGELTSEELAAFEKQMRADPALANEVKLYKTLGEDIKLVSQPDKTEKELRGNIATLNKEYFKPEAPVIKMKKIWWLGAAAAVAAIVLLMVKPFTGEKFNNEKLYTYYSEQIDQLSPVQRGSADDTELVKAAELYNSKQYEQVVPMLDKLITAHPDDKDLALAKGVSLLQTGNAQSAITIFDEIIKSETVYKNPALWFKGLSFLKIKKLSECRDVLKNLPASADKYKEAQELIKKIEKELK